jgi:TetR/AcrR family fatty acid metabolism transcriptional regulator
LQVPKVVDAAEQRARIREAAREVFARRGMTATGLAQIAAEAGMSRTGFYHYYPDKVALVRDLARELLGEEERLFEEALAGEGAVGQRIERLADAVLERFVAWSSYGRPLLEIWAQETRRLRPQLARMREVLASLIAQGQRDGEIAAELAPKETAAVLMGLVDGLMLQVFIDPAGVRASRAMRAALVTALRGILRAEDTL